jgi:DUF177 domain-containing protein
MTRRPRPETFDAYRLARERGVLEGTLDVAASERLADRVAPGAAAVDWRIEGTTDEVGRPALSISITGKVPLECQRCLAPFALPIAQRTVAVLAKSESDADAVDADSDDEVLVADHPLDPAVLIEEELLLTLPYAPMHDEGRCEEIGSG